MVGEARLPLLLLPTCRLADCELYSLPTQGPYANLEVSGGDAVFASSWVPVLMQTVCPSNAASQPSCAAHLSLVRAVPVQALCSISIHTESMLESSHLALAPSPLLLSPQLVVTPRCSCRSWICPKTTFANAPPGCRRPAPACVCSTWGSAGTSRAHMKTPTRSPSRQQYGSWRRGEAGGALHPCLEPCAVAMLGWSLPAVCGVPLGMAVPQPHAPPRHERSCLPPLLQPSNVHRSSGARLVQLTCTATRYFGRAGRFAQASWSKPDAVWRCQCDKGLPWHCRRCRQMLAPGPDHSPHD